MAQKNFVCDAQPLHCKSFFLLFLKYILLTSNFHYWFLPQVGYEHRLFSSRKSLAQCLPITDVVDLTKNESPQFGDHLPFWLCVISRPFIAAQSLHQRCSPLLPCSFIDQRNENECLVATSYHDLGGNRSLHYPLSLTLSDRQESIDKRESQSKNKIARRRHI